MAARLDNLILAVTCVFVVGSVLGLEYPLSFQIGLFLLLSVVLGISHGSLDHLVTTKLIRNGRQKAYLKLFVFLYILAAVLYGVAWYLVPLMSAVLLLVFSAFHFGQAELQAHVTGVSKWRARASYMYWGTAVITSLLYCNWDSTIGVLLNLELISDALVERLTVAADMLLLLTGIMLVATIIDVGVYAYSGAISGKRSIKLVIGFLLLHALFFTTPFLIAFSIFFGLWHSLKVLSHEFQGFKALYMQYTIGRFTGQLLPFSLISYAGVGLIAALWYYLDLEGPWYLYIIVFIASLALPHAVVMDSMYDRLDRSST